MLGLKTSKEGGFLRFSRTALKDFRIFLCASDDDEAHKKTVQLDAQGVALIEKAIVRQKVGFGPKKHQNDFFRGFHVCSETLQKITAWIRWGWNSQDILLNGSARCRNYKKGIFMNEQFAFHAKIFKKRVLGVFRHCTTKNLGNFAAMLSLRTNLQVTWPFWTWKVGS